jgi:predicted outer membrane repeat protein
VIFDGEGLHSLFRVTNNAALTLEQMTLRNAVGQFLWERDHGGAISLVNATLTVHGVDFLDNLASDNHGGAIGAYVGGDDRADPYINLVITDSTFVGNEATEGGGAIAITGGNMDADSPVVVSIEGSTFLNNSAQNWAGDLADDTYNSYNEWTIRDTTFTGSTCVDGSASMGVVLWGLGRLTLDRVHFDTLLSTDTSMASAVLFSGDEVEADLSDVSVQHATTIGGGRSAIAISGLRNHARMTDVSIFDARSAEGGVLVITGGSDTQAELSGITITQTETGACGHGALFIAAESNTSTVLLQDIVLEQIVGAGPTCSKFSALHLNGAMAVTASNLDFGQGERANLPLDLAIEPNTTGVSYVEGLGADIGLDCPTLETCTILRP